MQELSGLIGEAVPLAHESGRALSEQFSQLLGRQPSLLQDGMNRTPWEVATFGHNHQPDPVICITAHECMMAALASTRRILEADATQSRDEPLRGQRRQPAPHGTLTSMAEQKRWGADKVASRSGSRPSILAFSR